MSPFSPSLPGTPWGPWIPSTPSLNFEIEIVSKVFPSFDLHLNTKVKLESNNSQLFWIVKFFVVVSRDKPDGIGAEISINVLSVPPYVL